MRPVIKRASWQESVWDYPRPPVIEPTSRQINGQVGNVLLFDTREAIRYLETSHPPTYYIPHRAIRMEFLRRNEHRTFCEFKGSAHYYDFVDDRPGHNVVVRDIGWGYDKADTLPGYRDLHDHIAFYAGRLDRAWVDGEVVSAQAGQFYGGWITSHVTGPFKGEPGTAHW